MTAMMNNRPRGCMTAGLLTALCLFADVPLASAQAVAPYDERLTRLAEVLGSVHYLSNLCGEPSNAWRDRMQTLLSTESPDPNRRTVLVASFNKGFRSFDSVYTQCTDQARAASQRYLSEGANLSAEINARYGE